VGEGEAGGGDAGGLEDWLSEQTSVSETTSREQGEEGIRKPARRAGEGGKGGRGG